MECNSIIGQRCKVIGDSLGNKRDGRKTQVGTIRGYYLNEFWHKFVYKAFHIEFDNGDKATYLAKDVKSI